MEWNTDSIVARREVLRWAGMALAGSMAGVSLPLKASAQARTKPLGTARYAIFIQLTGAMSQMDCWDYKETKWTPKDLDPQKVWGDLYLPKTLFGRMMASKTMTAIAQRERKKWGVTPSYYIEEQIGLFRGAHSFKFGGKLDLRRGGAPDQTNAGVTYQTLNDVMNNTPSQVNLNMQQSEFYRWTMNGVSLFLQDDWRATRKLVLNLGLRYDRFGAFVATGKPPEDQTAIYNPNGLLNSDKFIWGPLRDVNQPYENDDFNFGPRFGFAYSIDGKGDFALRGGFGLNFSGFDGSSFETTPNRAPGLPVTVNFSRAESAQYGLKFPAYNEDMGWGEHTEGVFHGCEKFFRPGYTANLVSAWIPAMHDVKGKLEAGVRVADVGCGKGASTILMAKAFPKSRFVGFDYHDKSIEAARESAKRNGVADNVTFEVAKAKEFPGRDYDFVTVFDCLHDMNC